MSEQELRITAEAKFEAVKSFISKLASNYEELIDSDNYDDFEPYLKNQIQAKSDLLDTIKDFIYNNS